MAGLKHRITSKQHLEFRKNSIAANDYVAAQAIESEETDEEDNMDEDDFGSFMPF